MNDRKTWTEVILEVKSHRHPHGKRVGKPYTWRDVAAVLWPHLPNDRTAALVYKVVKHPDYHPGQDVCEKLGLIYYRPTPVCVLHGVVHCYDCTTQEVRPARKLNGKRTETVPQSIRLGSLTDVERQAILSLNPKERKRALLDAAAGR